MAAKKMLQKVQREITCSICRSYFSELVTIRCGHSKVCLSCIERAEAKTLSCPECRQVSQVRESPIVNGHLAQLTELGKQLCSQFSQTTRGQSQCARHKEDFKFFCEDDQTPLCVRCSQSPEHGAHRLSPVDEAAHNFRGKLQHMWSHCRKHFEETEKLLAQEKPDIDWQRMITGEFDRLHYFLMEEKSQCLERMKQEQRASQDRISQLTQTLQDLILELQEAGDQADLDLLQDAEQLLGRGESVLSQWSKAVIPELREDPIPSMIEMLSQFRVDITLNPTSASPCVTVSEDLRNVKAREAWQAETKHFELNSDCYGVLSKQTFSSGRQYWEVDVTQLSQWMLGIYTPYLRRKRKRNEDSSHSLFLLLCFKKEEDYYFQTHPGPLKHRIKGPVPRIGVYLEYSLGTLAFYNILQQSLIYRYHSIPFTAPVIPIFSPGPPLPGTKAGPMTLCPVDSYLCLCCYPSF